MKVFVTGASGCVGGDLLKYLISQHGDRVVALSRSEQSDCRIKKFATEAAPRSASGESLVDEYLKIVRGDVNSPLELLTEALEGVDVFYHAAAHVAAGGNRGVFIKVTVEGTANCVNAAKRANVQAFVLVSTIAVLVTDKGDKNSGTEDTPKNVPRNWGHYTSSKSLQEDVVLKAASNTFCAVSVRSPIVYGEGDNGILPGVVALSMAGAWRLFKPDDHLVSVVSVRNLSHCLHLAATKGKPGRVYHVQDDDSPRLANEFWRTYASTKPGVKIPTDTVYLQPYWWLATVIENLPDCIQNMLEGKYMSRQILSIFSRDLPFDSRRSARELEFQSITSYEDIMKSLARLNSTTVD